MTGRLLLLQLTAVVLLFSQTCQKSAAAVELEETEVEKLWRFLRGSLDTQRDARVVRSRRDEETPLASTTKQPSIPGINKKLAAASLLKRRIEAENNSVALQPQKETTEKTRSSSRQHKAFFVNYPVVQRVYKDKEAKPPTASPLQRKKQKLNNKKRKTKPDSDIYVIKLPPAPYNYVPGLGYISQAPSFSLTRKKPKPKPQDINPFIKLATKFVSNGKPTAVYKWTPNDADNDDNDDGNNVGGVQKQKPSYKDSPVIRLNRGPYVFDGKPMSMYVIKRRNSPNSY